MYPIYETNNERPTHQPLFRLPDNLVADRLAWENQIYPPLLLNRLLWLLFNSRNCLRTLSKGPVNN